MFFSRWCVSKSTGLPIWECVRNLVRAGGGGFHSPTAPPSGALGLCRVHSSFFQQWGNPLLPWLGSFTSLSFAFSFCQSGLYCGPGWSGQCPLALLSTGLWLGGSSPTSCLWQVIVFMIRTRQLRWLDRRILEIFAGSWPYVLPATIVLTLGEGEWQPCLLSCFVFFLEAGAHRYSFLERNSTVFVL